MTIGFRFQVGGDWGTYLQNYRNLDLNESSISTFMVREPGWLILSYVSKYISPGEIYPLNLMCATIFLLGLERLSASTKRKYFALAISYPILIILVGMGYTRQSVAIGFCFISLNYLSSEKDLWKFFLFSILAFSFHNTSIFFTLVFFLFNRDNKFPASGLIFVASILLIVLCTSFGDYYFSMINEYIYLADYRASGAISRGVPILISSLGFLSLAKYIGGGLRLNRNISIISVLIFTYMLLIAPYTALDRIYLYFSSIYIIFLGNLGISKYSYQNIVYEALVLLTFFVYIIIWFKFGKNYSFWIPYDNYLRYLFL
jgi:hypothetical protein